MKRVLGWLLALTPAWSFSLLALFLGGWRPALATLGLFLATALITGLTYLGMRMLEGE